MAKDARLWMIGTIDQLEELDSIVQQHNDLQAETRRAIIYTCPPQHVDALLTCARAANVYAEVLNRVHVAKKYQTGNWWTAQRQAALDTFPNKGWFRSRDVREALHIRHPNSLLRAMRQDNQLEHRGSTADSRYRVPKDVT